MTIYYIDSDAAGGGDGSYSTPWNTLATYMEGSRTAGDIAILRRGTTADYDDGTTIGTISDGTHASPITVICDGMTDADHDGGGTDLEAWSADFADSAQTYTLTFGDKTATASATITGISVGDWFVNKTDDNTQAGRRAYSYEVTAVGGTTLTFRHPFKGTTGSGKTLRVMPALPVYGDAVSNMEISFQDDTHWLVQGLHSKATGSFEHFNIRDSLLITFRDCKFTDGGNGHVSSGEFALAYIDKCFFSLGSGYLWYSAAPGAGSKFYQTILTSTGAGVWTPVGCDTITLEEFEHTSATGNVVTFSGSTGAYTFVRGRYITSSSSSDIINGQSDLDGSGEVFVDDWDGTVGKTAQFLPYADTDDTISVESDTGTVRGSSPYSILVTPIGQLSTATYPFSFWKLLELPFYATTASKTYTVYLKTENTTDWTANPTADEFFLEAEYYAASGNAYKKRERSTGTVNFTGVTTWESIAVTITPAQAGVLMLRLYYGKPKESTKTNVFRIDPVVEVS